MIPPVSHQRVLLVSQDEGYLCRLPTYFADHGFIIDAYATLQDALHSIYEPNNAYLAVRPWLIILDMNLGEMKAQQETEKLFHACGGQKIPVVVVNCQEDDVEFMPIWKKLEVKLVFSQMPADGNVVSVIFKCSQVYWNNRQP